MRLAALLAAALLAAAAENPEALRLLDEWIAAVDQHVPGQRDAGLESVAAWSLEDIDLVRGYIEVFSGVRNDTASRAFRRRAINRMDLASIRERANEMQARGGFDGFLKRAAMLHTDTALVDPFITLDEPPKRKPRGARLLGEPEPIVDVISADGRVDSYTIANPNWQIAMDLLETLPAKPARDPIVAQWYRAIGAYFAEQDNRADAVRHFARARTVVADDPGVLFGEACLEETLGSPGIQNFARLARLPNGMTLTAITSPRTHFTRAEALLKRALAAKPDFVDARLRLGHVLVELEEYESALPHLAQVIAASKDPAMLYYAHLFSGDAAFALSRLAESRESYERAIATHPESQAARLGLAAASRAAGDRTAARDAAMSTLTSPPQERDSKDEPWWEYYKGDAANVGRLMRELHTAVPRRTP